MDASNLAALEKKAYRSVVDDGVIDICLGFFMLVFGLVLATDIHLFGTVDLPIFLFLLIYPLWRGLRKRVIEPRIGYVRLRADRMAQIKRNKKTIVYAFFWLMLGMAALLSRDAGWVAPLQDVKVILIGCAMGVPIALAAALLHVRRWWFHTVIAIAGPIVEHFGGLPAGSGWLASGAVIVAIGGFVLMTFLRDYTTPADTEAANA